MVLMIKLRQFTISDIDFILNNWSNTERIKGCYFPNDAKKLTKIINEWAAKSYQGKYFEQFAIVHSECIVGMISLYEVNISAVSAGVSIDKKYYRNGYAMQALNLIKEVAKSKGYKKLVSTCRTNNNASIKLHEKFKFNNQAKSINKKGNEIYRWYYELWIDNVKD